MHTRSLIRPLELDQYVREQSSVITSKDVSLAMVEAFDAGDNLAAAVNRLPIFEQFATEYALYKQYAHLCKLLERNVRSRLR